MHEQKDADLCIWKRKIPPARWVGLLCYTRYSPKQMSVNANGYNDEYDWGPNSAQ